MDGEASHVVAHELDLAPVNPGTNRDAEMRDRGTNRPGTSNRAGGTVEHRKKSVAGGLDVAPSKAVELEAVSRAASDLLRPSFSSCKRQWLQIGVI